MFISNQYNPYDGVNFLRSKNKKRKIVHGFSIILIVSSLGLLTYPFFGSYEYLWMKVTGEKTNPTIAHADTNFGLEKLKNEENDSVKNTVESFILSASLNPAPEPTPLPDAATNPTPSPFEQNIKTTALTEKKAVSAVVKKETPQGKKLLIPSIGVSIDIKGGIDPRILNSGAAWHIPGTADPVQAAKYNKNFTLGAHRYAYRPPSKNTFYNLDKVAVGDIVQVYWDGQEYNYQVDEVKVVEPEDVEILEPGDENKITLFTCTPLFTSKQRLVVTGRPIN